MGSSGEVVQYALCIRNHLQRHDIQPINDRKFLSQCLDRQDLWMLKKLVKMS